MIKYMKWIQNITVVMLFVFLLAWILFNTIDNPRYDLIFLERKLLAEGIWTTLYVSIITLVVSMVIGFLFYLMMQSHIQLIKATVIIFKEIVMGTPLLVMIFLVVYVLGNIINLSNKVVLGIIALTLYMTPYLANAYQSAITIIDEDQYKVMELYHFTKFQKYWYVVFPQIIKPLMPSIINNLSSIVKGSALLKIVSVTEISYVITVISAKNWASVEGYLVMWMLYLMITIPLSMLAQYVGRELRNED